MIRALIRLGAACLLLLCGAAPAASQTVDAILARHLEALGGRAKLAQLHAIRLKGTLDLGADGVFPITLEAKRPGRFRLESRASDGLVYLRLFDGTKGWAADPGGPVFTMTDRDAAAEREDGFDGILLADAASGCRFEFMEHQGIGGRDTYRVKATRKDNQASTHWIDTQTFLEFQREVDRDTPAGRRTFVIEFSDFRIADGFVIPFRRQISQRFSAKQMVIQFDQVVLNPEIPDSDFELNPAR